jgi:hypothetical protein
VAQTVGHLLSKSETLNLNPSATIKKIIEIREEVNLISQIQLFWKGMKISLLSSVYINTATKKVRHYLGKRVIIGYPMI